MRQTRTICVVTGGGDCLGLNAVIRAVVFTAKPQRGCVRAGRFVGITFGDQQ